MKIDMTQTYQVYGTIYDKAFWIVKVILVISYVRIIVLQYGAYLINNPFIMGIS